MDFEWNAAKNAANFRKHGLPFEIAARVFDDPHHVSAFNREVGKEIRWHTIGSVENIVVIMVVHTLRHQGGKEVMRIISARKASRLERKHYEKNKT
jgi:uncharacterized protein